jgi:cystathionine gamma-synthase
MNEADDLDTLCVHAGREPDPTTGAVSQPLYLTTTFQRDADGGYPRGYQYARHGHPNRAALEDCLAQLERGIGAAAFGSGSAASLAVFQLLRAGERVLAPREAYHGTLRQLEEACVPRGVHVDLADLTDLDATRAALRQGTRLIWAETPSNPRLGITDIVALATLAREHGAWLACDNTFATPVCQRPLALGAQLVMHSTTKYLGGHSDVLGGAVIVRDDATLLERLHHWQSLAGAVPAPFDCWLLRRSITTLPVRVRAQCATAARLAERLAAHPEVEQVFYPGLPLHPGHALASRQMHGGYGAMLSFCVRGDARRALAVCAATRLFTRATSLGGVESLIEQRASMEGPDSRTPQNLLRVSVGLESAADLVADLDAALQATRG